MNTITEQRKKLASRKRRLILNNDGCDVLMPEPDVTVDSFLSMRTSMLAGTQVDTVVYCTAKGGFPQFAHRTEIGEIYRAAPLHKDKYNAVPGLMALGTDPLDAVIRFCHDNGMESFWSMRMNDGHDGYYHQYHGTPLSSWKQANQERLLGPGSSSPDDCSWRLNYADDKARELVFLLVQEVCENYDVDGIELDFMRDPILFRSHWQGRTPDDEECCMLTDLLERIRKMTDRIGAVRGRPVLLAVHVPDSVEYCRECGIELDIWLEKGLVDILVPGERIVMQPWPATVLLGHRSGVQVYPCISDCTMRDRAAVKRRQNIETYRARAANAWRSGADGIYIFNPWLPGLSDSAQALDKRKSNSFESGHPAWRELGSIDTLQNLEKHFYASFLGPPSTNAWGPAGRVPDADRFMVLPSLCPDCPVELEPGQTVSFNIEIMDQIDPSVSEAWQAEALLRILTCEKPDSGALTVMLNKQLLRVSPTHDGWLECIVPVQLIFCGGNTVEIKLSDKQSPVQILDAVIKLKYK